MVATVGGAIANIGGFHRQRDKPMRQPTQGLAQADSIGDAEW